MAGITTVAYTNTHNLGERFTTVHIWYSVEDMGVWRRGGGTTDKVLNQLLNFFTQLNYTALKIRTEDMRACYSYLNFSKSEISQLVHETVEECG